MNGFFLCVQRYTLFVTWQKNKLTRAYIMMLYGGGSLIRWAQDDATALGEASLRWVGEL